MILLKINIICLLLLALSDTNTSYLLEDQGYNPYTHGALLFQNVRPRGYPDPRKDNKDVGQGLHPTGILEKHSGIRLGSPEGQRGTKGSDKGLRSDVVSSLGSVLKGHWSNLGSKTGTQDSKVPTNIGPWDLLLFVMRADLYLPSRNRTIVKNEQCVEDVKAIYEPQTDEQWSVAFQMIDSWGKVPDGLFGGNTLAPGAFDECVSLRLGTNATISKAGGYKGKYCTLHLQNGAKNVNLTEVGIPGLMVSGYPSFYSFYGTCIPSSCTRDDLLISLNVALAKNNKSVGSVQCQTDEPQPVEYTPGLIFMICLLSLFGTLLLVGAAVDTWIDFTGKGEMRQGPLKYLLAFSLTTNLQKMFNINTAENKEAITCLYGMRVLSMTWVVWCHQYSISLFIDGDKLSYVDVFNGHWLTQIILNGYPSVDSFFFMSGLLVAYGVLREKKRTGKINLFVFYVHRYIRLAVPILILCGFLATFSEYLAYGPFASFAKGPYSLRDACQKYWWRDAFFISNFYINEGTPVLCLDVCWYTAVDFQLFLIAPLILFPFLWGEWFQADRRKLNKVGMVWLGVVVFFSTFIPGIITGLDKLPPTSIMSSPDQEKGFKYIKEVYQATHCRAQPYLAGMVLGILFRSDSKRKLKLETWQVILGWLLATATGLAVVFGMYDYNQFNQYPGYNWADSIFYGSLHRLAWGLALAWVVFACHYGYGGAVNGFLSHPSWQPLSRLTYCMFLVALPLQTILFLYCFFYPSHFSHLDKVLQTVGVLFISGIGAVLLSLCSEAPVMSLEKFLLRRDKVKS
ncbi:nose resistant to fluoxetine protein 6-like [Macrobrachium rosenbergii]|uniref:nose resistant to fluoxetine protein 6-like n=1 Tax=Macrobrachium rosenbergii TaxID=79674 RepID=UPI0034D3D7AF